MYGFCTHNGVIWPTIFGDVVSARYSKRSLDIYVWLTSVEGPRVEDRLVTVSGTCNHHSNCKRRRLERQSMFSLILFWSLHCELNSCMLRRFAERIQSLSLILSSNVYNRSQPKLGWSEPSSGNSMMVSTRANPQAPFPVFVPPNTFSWSSSTSQWLFVGWVSDLSRKRVVSVVSRN